MFPLPPRRAVKEIGRARLQANSGTLPTTLGNKFPEPKGARGGERQTQHVAEHRPVFMPSDRGSRTILGDQDLLHVRKDETRSGLNLAVDVEQKRRNRNCRHDFVAAEIVPPAERHNPTFAFKTVELELLKGEIRNLIHQPAFVPVGNGFRAVVEAGRKRWRRGNRKQAGLMCCHSGTAGERLIM